MSDIKYLSDKCYALEKEIAAAKAEAKRMREWWALAIERGELLQKYFDENARLREALEKIVQDKTHACAIAQSALDGGKP
jgi:hypothetical protein